MGVVPHLDRTQRGQPPRHKVSAIELIVSVVTKSPAHKEQNLCAEKAYDADDLREFLASAGYEAHIKVNPRRKGLAESAAEHPPNDDESSKRIHPARRWMVERTISWLVKRRSLCTRWAKKAENWLGLIQ
jgi:putative transposase